MAAQLQTRDKLLYVVTEDWYFVSHRLPLAVAAMQCGMEVHLAANFTGHESALKAAGIRLHPWQLKRGSTNIFSELRALISLWRIFRDVRPRLAHQVAIKPVLYGCLVARLCGRARLVNALGGMGALFVNSGDKRSALRSAVLFGFRWLIRQRHSVLILQNEDDCEFIVRQTGLARDSVRLIKGAGVNLKEFSASAEAGSVPLVVLPARMLRDKGVVEFVEAARLLQQRGSRARFVLVGGLDECNPAALSQRQLEAWVQEGLVEWWGRRNDMPAVYAASSVICLPSYREGLPKALLEAAACRRAIVTTDVPGCREVVKHGKNGLLVPVQDPAALAAALAELIDNPGLRSRMGQAGRKMVAEEFSEESVVQRTLEIYRSLLQEHV